jgi:dipeptidyl-peptidase 4
VNSQLVVVDVESGDVAEFEHPLQSATWESPLLMGRAWWSDDGQRIWFIHMGRGERSATLLELDVASGTTRTVLTESTPMTMDLHPTLGLPPIATVLESAGEVLWFSERDGWGHLYLYDLATGALKRQLTRGAWVVRDVLRTDETSRFVYLLGAGREPERDPYYRHLYRVSLDGGEPELLTPEDADHEAFVAPDTSVFVDNASTVSEPPVARLRACDGRLIAVLEEADVSALDAVGWRRPERFTVKARDGATDLYGTLFYPRDFDPSKRYLVVEDIYGWRQTTHAPVRMRAEQDHPFDLFDYWYPQAVAELGFIVVTLDALGTPYRSRAFHEVSYGAAEDVIGLRDHVGALRQLAAARPYLDLQRVGVYGHSAGGLATALAMLRHPDVYAVGIASSPGQDMRLYDIDSCEKDLAMFPGGSDGSSTNAALLAERLAGKLFIVYGELDDNTHPAMALRLVDALIKADKPFDLLVMPGANHSLQFEPYFLRRSWDHLVEHLLGEEPPTDVAFRPDDLCLPRCISTPAVAD